MHRRIFSGDPVRVSEVGLGTWQFGGTEWGSFDESDALATLRAAADAGITFLDTADIYGLGRSERLIGRFLRETPGYQAVCRHQARQKPGPRRRRQFLARRRFASTPRSRWNGSASKRWTCNNCIACRWSSLQRGEVFDWLRTLQHEGKIKRWARASNPTKKRRSASPRTAWHRCKSSSTSTARSRSPSCSTRRSERAWRSSSGCRWRAVCSSGRYTKSTTFARDRSSHVQPQRREVQRRRDVRRLAVRARRRADRGIEDDPAGRAIWHNGRCGGAWISTR